MLQSAASAVNHILVEGKMTNTPAHEVTELLRAWSNGDQAALEKLAPLVDDELHRLAKAYLAQERRDHTLQTTALVNEAYLRLIDQQAVQWESRAHFYGVCARLMRQILVDYARVRRSVKHGGETIRVTLDEAVAIPARSEIDLIALDDALISLARIDPRKSRIVELRFFGGLTVEETAEVLGISVSTVHAEWRLAKMWLLKELSSL